MGIVVIFGLILLVLTQTTVAEDLSAESYANGHSGDAPGPSR